MFCLFFVCLFVCLALLLFLYIYFYDFIKIYQIFRMGTYTILKDVMRSRNEHVLSRQEDYKDVGQ